MPRVTVVMPCFNHGKYIDEAIASVLAQTFRDFEIVVVDDGSTDSETVALLSDYRRPKTRVILSVNQGPAAARNLGIRSGSGEYILPLDADDRIAPTYLEKAVRLLDQDSRLGIVYCEADYFGDRSGPWTLPPFSMPEILWENMIFCTGLFRRSSWVTAGEYREELREGWEDWDFWLALMEQRCQVHRIPEVLFFYRFSNKSRNRDLESDQLRLLRTYEIMVRQHIRLFARYAADFYDRRRMFTGRKHLAARIALAALATPWPLDGSIRRMGTAFRLLKWALAK